MSSQLNPRVEEMRPSKTMAVATRARELRREGAPVIALSAGEPDFPTPASISQAGIKAIQDGHTRYTDVAGVVTLREKLVEKLNVENGLTYSANEILCCNGAKQAVAQAIMALSRPGDEVLIPAPYWVSYPDMAILSGATPVVISTTAQASYRINAEQLRAAITDKTKILMMCSPSNPTGSAYSREEQAAIAEVVAEHDDLYVISDEIYEHIVFGISHVSFASLPGMWERTITVNGFSKAFAMTGWRLGYLAAPEWIVKAARKIQGQTTSAPSTISQYAGIAALEMDAGPIQEMVAAFRERRDYMLDALREIPGVICPKPDGAFYLFPNVSHYYGMLTPDGELIEDDEKLCVYLLEKYHVALVPGGAFGDPNGVRISYAASAAELEEAMQRIKSGLAALRSRT